MRTRKDPDRYLTTRSGVYYYSRRVPTRAIGVEPKSPLIRRSLKTDDLALARVARDFYETAENERWSGLVDGTLSNEEARTRYLAATAYVESMGFQYQTSQQISQASLSDIVRRIIAVSDKRTTHETIDAVLGAQEAPTTTLTQAFEIYLTDIVSADLAKKSPSQKKRWIAKRRLSLNGFIDLVGDKDILKVNREDALVLKKYWLSRILATSGSSDKGGNEAGVEPASRLRTY